jgi:hypothetical protein
MVQYVARVATGVAEGGIHSDVTTATYVVLALIIVIKGACIPGSLFGDFDTDGRCAFIAAGLLAYCYGLRDDSPSVGALAMDHFSGMLSYVYLESFKPLRLQTW